MTEAGRLATSPILQLEPHQPRELHGREVEVLMLRHPVGCKYSAHAAIR